MKIEIDIPEGYEVDTENITKECIKLKKIENKLPNTWEEFCETHPRKAGEGYFDSGYTCHVVDETTGNRRHSKFDRNLLPSKELAEAMLALCQLIQLRDCYNDGWKPNWLDSAFKNTIVICANKPMYDTTIAAQHILAFKTKKLRDQFLENFQDLIEIAKPLL